MVHYDWLANLIVSFVCLVIILLTTRKSWPTIVVALVLILGLVIYSWPRAFADTAFADKDDQLKHEAEQIWDKQQRKYMEQLMLDHEAQKAAGD